ncbi:MAG: adenylosuccinate synthetase [Ruminococcus sp.]|nr:adenylosuccinate synthetase [Ruminococcus sp.]
MRKAYAVIGANFGDEGKGLMTDYFCRQGGRVINVRSNGGAQAGHTVCTQDNKRHVFSHIGAGTFAGADTYLSEFFTVNPMLFMKEYGTFVSETGIYPKIFADPCSAVSVPCDMLINQFLERQRGKDRHGSCGMGIYESVKRNSDAEYAVRFGDIFPGSERNIYDKISRINKLYAPKRLKELGFEAVPDELREALDNDAVTDNFIDDMFDTARICSLSDGIPPAYDTAVFEGAQGLMLDCGRSDYFPNLTPSNTGMKNVRSLLNGFKPDSTEICYVTRSYFTRHGAGRFDTESAELAKSYGLTDRTNVTNEFQGGFRFGYFDPEEFERSVALDRKYVKKGDMISVCVTHLDCTDGKLICQDKNMAPETAAGIVGAQKLYLSFGERAADVSVKETGCL